MVNIIPNYLYKINRTWTSFTYVATSTCICIYSQILERIIYFHIIIHPTVYRFITFYIATYVNNSTDFKLESGLATYN